MDKRNDNYYTYLKQLIGNMSQYTCLCTNPVLAA